MNYDQMFPGRFIKAGEFNGKDVTLTIKELNIEDLEGEDGEVDRKPILSFVERDREIALNKENALSLFAMWPDTDDWPGKKVTFTPEHDDSGLSDSGFCIRVKGSPDIPAPVQLTIRRRHRKNRTRTLQVTKAGKQEQLKTADDVEF